MFHKRLYKMILCFLMVLLGILGYQCNTDAAEQVGEVTFSVEKFTISQGYLIDPCVVPIYQGENAAHLVDRVLKEYGYTYENNGSLTDNFYLSSINNADSGNYRIPAIIKAMDDFTHNNTGDNETTDHAPTGDETNIVYPDLAEFSYTQNSGWMYSVNNVFPEIAISGKTLVDGDVMRIQFTVYGYGADLGSGHKDSSLKPLDLPDRQEITKRLALMKKYKDACDEAGVWSKYLAAYKKASDLSTLKKEMTSALNSLPTEEEIRAYADTYDQKQAEAFKEKAEALGTIDLSSEKAVASLRASYEALTLEQKAKVSKEVFAILNNAENRISQLKKQKEEQEKKKQEEAAKPAPAPVDYTPSATSLKSLKQAKGKKVTITWKKVTNVSGYEIYMSLKKNTGYKKIATVKKQATIKYTKKGLKKKKIYYFKIRTYRTVNGKTYYGKYSNIKKIKVTK